MSILFNYSSELKSSFADLKDSTSPTNWILYGYEGDDLRLVSKGCDGITELKEEFDEECVQYALLKLFDAASKMSRYIYIAWCGEYSQPFQKANFSQHSQIVEKFLNGFHVKINARCYEDVEPEAVISRVQNSSFTSFSKTNLKPKSPRPSPFASKRQTPSVSPPPKTLDVELEIEKVPDVYTVHKTMKPVSTFTITGGIPKKETNIKSPVFETKPNPLSPKPAAKANPLAAAPKANPLNPKANPLAPVSKANPLNPKSSPVNTNVTVTPAPTPAKTNPLAPASRVNPLAPTRVNPLSPVASRPNPLSPSASKSNTVSPTTTTTTTTNPLSPKPNPLSPKPNPLAPKSNPLSPPKPSPNPLPRSNPLNPPKINPLNNTSQVKPALKASSTLFNKPHINYANPSLANVVVTPTATTTTTEKVNKVEENESLIDTSSRDSVANVKLMFEKKPEKVSKIKIKSPFFHPENNFKSKAKVREERIKREQEDNALREREEMANKQREMKETISISRKTNDTVFESSKAELTLPKSTPLNLPKSNPLNPPKSTPLNLPKSNPLNPPKSNPLNPPKSNPLNPPKSNPLNPPKSNPLNPPKSNPLNPPKSNPLNPPKSNPLNPPKSNPLNPPKITAESSPSLIRSNPLAPPSLPTRENPLAPPSLPIRENPLAPPPLPARDSPLAPPPLPFRNDDLEREKREREEQERREREEQERREREEQERREREEQERREREEQERREREEQERRELEEQEKLARPKLENAEGKSAIVTFDYEPSESNEIALVEGEIIRNIVQLIGGWCQGENSKGECGLFPSNFVEMMEDDTEEVKEAETERPPELPKRNNQQVVSAIALYDYEAQEDGEISFKEGDIITNIKFESDDWWEGVCNDECGYFPGNYVEINGN